MKTNINPIYLQEGELGDILSPIQKDRSGHFVPKSTSAILKMAEKRNSSINRTRDKLKRLHGIYTDRPMSARDVFVSIGQDMGARNWDELEAQTFNSKSKDPQIKNILKNMALRAKKGSYLNSERDEVTRFLKSVPKNKRKSAYNALVRSYNGIGDDPLLVTRMWKKIKK